MTLCAGACRCIGPAGRRLPRARNTSSPHWRGWLKSENRCLVPANSFAEYAPDSEPCSHRNDYVDHISRSHVADIDFDLTAERHEVIVKRPRWPVSVGQFDSASTAATQLENRTSSGSDPWRKSNTAVANACAPAGDRTASRSAIFSKENSKLKRFPPDLNRRDSQRVKDERIFVH
jgi:hypothetical protein